VALVFYLTGQEIGNVSFGGWRGCFFCITLAATCQQNTKPKEAEGFQEHRFTTGKDFCFHIKGIAV
jgi:hypothetical protein